MIRCECGRDVLRPKSELWEGRNRGRVWDQTVGSALEPFPDGFFVTFGDTGAVFMNPDRDPTVFGCLRPQYGRDFQLQNCPMSADMTKN